jgi:dGTPase
MRVLLPHAHLHHARKVHCHHGGDVGHAELARSHEVLPRQLLVQIGEEALHAAMQDHGGFRHNAQSARIVDYLEDRYGHGLGLNLTLAVRRSLLKGRIPDGFPLSADLLPKQPPPIEAHVVDLCDKIAYLSHDLDDGLRAELFGEAEAAELRLWRAAAASSETNNRQRIVSEVASLLIHDLVETSEQELRGTQPRVRHSDAMTVMANELLEFLRVRFYRSERVLKVMHDGAARIRAVFAALCQDPGKLPEGARKRLATDGRERTVCDYVAGMTDRYLGRIAAAL